MPLIHRLPSSTVKLISSSQIITSVSSVVKELLENAIDAGAGNIEIKLDNHGQDGIEVRDNGSGVKKADVPSMCQPNCTSKIQEFHDLEQLESYGFRGEALGALCRVSDVCVTTRTKEDDLAMVYTIDHNGNVLSSKPSALGTGTTVTVTRLFHNLPVRKQYLTSGKRAKDELKKTESIIKSLALINPSLRVTFCHNRCLIWQKQSVTKLRDSLMQVIGLAMVNKLEELSYTKDEVNITLLVPKKNCEGLESLCQSHIECMMIYVNKRPVRYKKLEKVVLRCISERFDGQLTARKYPTCLVSVVTSPSDLDVNLEPNKTKVLLKDEEEVLQIVENMLVTYYGIKLETPKANEASENNLNSTDNNLNDSLEETEKDCEPLKAKSKPPITTVQNNIFKKQGICELEGEIMCKRLKLDLAGEATSEKIAESKMESNEINRMDSPNAQVHPVSASANNHFLDRINNPLEKCNSYNSFRKLHGQGDTSGQSVENLGRVNDGNRSLEIPSLSMIGSLANGRTPVSNSVVETVRDCENLSMLRVVNKNLETTSLSALGSLSSGRSPISDSVVERVTNGGINLYNVSILRDGDQSMETPLPSKSESMSNVGVVGNEVNRAVNFQKPSMSRDDDDKSMEQPSLSELGSLSSGRSPVSDSFVKKVVDGGINSQKVSRLRDGNDSAETSSLSVSETMSNSEMPVTGNMVSRTVNFQKLNMSQDGNKTIVFPSLSAVGSLSSGRSPVSDSVVKNVVRGANFQNLNRLEDAKKTLSLSMLKSTSCGKSPFRDSVSMTNTTEELQGTLISGDNQSLLDTTQFVGTIKQNEINELLTLSDADIAKELGTEFHTDKSADDASLVINTIGIESEREARQGTQAHMPNKSFLSSKDDFPGNKEISNVMELGGDMNPVLKEQEACVPLVENASESWTRGLLKAPNGNIIQGAAVLLSKSCDDVQPKTIDMSLQRVTGQMEKKEHKAFVKFSKEERAKVLKENPGIIFTKIAGVLLERWQALSPVEQACYHETERPKSSIVQSPGQQDIRKLGNKTAGQNETVKAKERWKIGNRKQQEMTVSLERLREPCEIILSQTEPPEVLVIGYANPDGPWVYKKKKELGVMRHWGLKETVVYHRMMAEHTVPLQKLDKPILVDDSTVGAENLQLLLSLKRNYDVESNAVIVTSDVIQKNGFRVEIKEGLEQTYCLLTDVASTINFYGLDDLKDTLDILRKRGIGPLEKCRNLRVAGYIRAQAVRIIHQSPNMLDKQAVQELVNYWSANASHLGSECLHRKPFFEKLHDLPG